MQKNQWQILLLTRGTGADICVLVLDTRQLGRLSSPRWILGRLFRLISNILAKKIEPKAKW